jgi:MFS family permease
MAWLVCLSAGLFFFYEFFQLNNFDVINDALRKDFQLDVMQMGWMSSAFLWANVLFLLPAGIILDRYSTRKVIILSMLICILGTLGFALTRSFLLGSFFHALTGIGNAFCFLSCVVLVSHWFSPKRQALVIGSIVTMAFLGGMAAHTPFAYLVNLYGWRNALLIVVVIGVLLLAWIAFIVQDWPNKAKIVRNNTTAPMLPGFLKAFMNRQVWLAGLYTSCLNLPIMVLGALWGATYLRVVHQLPDMAASNIVSLIFLGSIIGCPLAGFLSDTQGKRKPVMIAGAALTLLALCPLFISNTLPQGLLSVLFFALGLFSSTQVVAYPLIAESTSHDTIGTATGLASVLIMGSAGFGQLVFAFLVQHHASSISNQYVVADFQFAMWMFPIVTILSLVAILSTRETNCTPSQLEIPRD